MNKEFHIMSKKLEEITDELKVLAEGDLTNNEILFDMALKFTLLKKIISMLEDIVSNNDNETTLLSE